MFLNPLLAALEVETDVSTRFDILDAVNVLTATHLGLSADWQLVASVIESPVNSEEVEAAIYILGNTLNPKFRDLVRGYANSSKEAVRAASLSASRMLAGKQQQLGQNKGQNKGDAPQ